MVTNKKETVDSKNKYDTLIKSGIGLLLIVAGATGSNVDRFWITPDELDAKLEKYVTKDELMKYLKDEPVSITETKTEEIQNLLKLSNGSGIGEK